MDIAGFETKKSRAVQVISRKYSVFLPNSSVQTLSRLNYWRKEQLVRDREADLKNEQW